jgi:ParB family chromosome partitioning protein
MGKRVNLAELAEDDLYEPASPATAGSSTAAPPDAQPSSRTAPIDTISLNPLNKRPPGADDQIDEMAETIRERGVIQPLVVCSVQAYLAEFPSQAAAVADTHWVVLIGNRRLLAAQLAALDDVPIIVNDESVTSMYEVMLIENGQRKELPPLLEAEAITEALKKASVSQRELARRIGKSHAYIRHRLALLKLIPELRDAYEQGELKIELAREFGELPRAEQEQIAATGKPYRMPGGNGVSTRHPIHSIRVSNPATAAESIRKRFSPDELAELIRLLTTQEEGGNAVST